MIKRETLQNTPTSPYYWVENILESNRDYYLTKEEIYTLMPKDERGMPLITISGLETALRTLLHGRIIEAELVNGKRHFAIREDKKR